MSEVINYFLEQFGILGAILITVCFLIWYLVFKQPKEIKKMGDTLSKDMLKAINDGNERNAGLLKDVITNTNNTNHEMLKYILNGKQTIHDELLAERSRVDSIIINYIRDLQLITKSDRVAVIEFHNNISNMDGLPFKSYDINYEWQAKGIDVIQQKVQNMNSSTLLPVIQDTKDEDFIIYTKEDLQNMYNRSSSLYHYLVELLDCEVISFSAIYNSNNILIGFVVIEYQNGNNEFETSYDIEEVQEYRAKISALLTINKED